MRTRSQLQQVKAVHRCDLNTRQVLESFLDAVVLGVHHERPTALHMTPVAHLTLARADLAGALRLLDILKGTDVLQDLHSLGSLVHVLHGGVQHKGALGDLADAMATGHDERRKGGGSKSGTHSVTALVHIDLAVPLAPCLGGVEHTTTTAHVAEGTLSSTVGTAARDTRN